MIELHDIEGRLDQLDKLLCWFIDNEYIIKQISGADCNDLKDIVIDAIDNRSKRQQVGEQARKQYGSHKKHIQAETHKALTETTSVKTQQGTMLNQDRTDALAKATWEKHDGQLDKNLCWGTIKDPVEYGKWLKFNKAGSYPEWVAQFKDDTVDFIGKCQVNDTYMLHVNVPDNERVFILTKTTADEYGIKDRSGKTLKLELINKHNKEN